MSAHVAGLVRATTTTALNLTTLVITTTLVLLITLLNIGGTGAAEMAVAVSATDSLLRFKAAMSNNKFLSNWNSSVPPCTGGHANWVGVSCSKGMVRGLVLERMNLMGPIDIDSLMPLVTHLRSISLKNNKFNGPMPPVKKLGPLKTLFLSNNHFSGGIPDDAFSGMGSLKKLYLSNNEFTGRIPSSVASLPRLMELRLDGNRFRGRIPDFTRAKSRKLRVFNVSRNQLTGPIPGALADKPASSFEGNEELCGEPLYKSCDGPSNPVVKFVIGVLVGVVIIGVLVLLLMVIVRNRRRRKIRAESSEPPSGTTLGRQGRSRSGATYQNPNQVQHTSRGLERMGSGKRDKGGGAAGGGGGGGDCGRLSFIRNDREKFDLQDLLRASAEVLGSGNYGSSYKADIANGQSLVVKRYKYLNCGSKDDFHDTMRRLGRLDHPNLLPLVAYYYRKEEKLLICDFVANGSLATQLHQKHSKDEAGLDWATRLKIVKGVAKGLAYLYAELPKHTVPHGHIKSSNVLLDKSFNAILTDYALVPLTSEEQGRQLMVAYKSPEYSKKKGRINKKTDVWGLGILILEILTGKYPENYLAPGHDSSNDIASWVNARVKEKKAGEVFDNEMMDKGGSKCKGQMMKMLKVGLSCCQEDPDTRPDIREVVEKLESLEETDDTYATAVTANEDHRLTEM